MASLRWRLSGFSSKKAARLGPTKSAVPAARLVTPRVWPPSAPGISPLGCRVQIIEGSDGELIDRETFEREHLKSPAAAGGPSDALPLRWRPPIARGLTPVRHHLRPRRRANPPVAGQREGGSWGYRLDSQSLFNRRQALGPPPSPVSRPPSRAFRFERFEARRLARCLEARVQLDLAPTVRRAV